MAERLVDVLDGKETVLHTYPITVETSDSPLVDDDFKDKALRASAHAELVSDEDLPNLSAKMHVSRGGTLRPYGDCQPALSQTKDSLNEIVRERAYLLWEVDGRPDGQADLYWLRAQEEHFRERAYILWRQEGCPDGQADGHWHRTREFEAH
jgi:hypothetical protein